MIKNKGMDPETAYKRFSGKGHAQSSLFRESESFSDKPPEKKKEKWTSAGCVVVKDVTPDGLDYVYLVVPSDEFYGKIVLPKGRVADGEGRRQTATREVGEEAGIRVRIFPDGYLGIFSGTMSNTHFYLAHPVASARQPKMDGEMKRVLCLPIGQAISDLAMVHNWRDHDVLKRARKLISTIKTQMQQSPELF